MEVKQSIGELSDATLLKISDFFYKKTGINLGLNKRYLYESRLIKVFSQHPKLRDWEDLYKELQKPENKTLQTMVVNALTTNFSFFFRDPVHFTFLKHYLEKKHEKGTPLRIWSAACSSGEEAYSIMITIMETLDLSRFSDIKILATDISSQALEKGQKGQYPLRQIEDKVDPKIVKKYFHQIDEGTLEINDDIKRFIQFRHFNLLQQCPSRKIFHLIYLRNALIYFNREEKELLLNNMSRVLKPDGYLIVGNSETLLNLNHYFKHIKNNVFTLKRDI